MKRAIALTLAILLAVFACVSAGASDGAGERTLREGKYIIGEDIPAGTYKLTCTGTAGEDLGDAYGAMGKAMDALDDTQGFGDLFGAFGNVMENYVGLTVEIVGDYGDILKTCNLKTGDSVSIRLEEKTALKISDGSCTIAPE